MRSAPPLFIPSQAAQCPACGSVITTLLGQLGHLVWFRCRLCGTDFSLLEEDR